MLQVYHSGHRDLLNITIEHNVENVDTYVDIPRLLDMTRSQPTLSNNHQLRMCVCVLGFFCKASGFKHVVVFWRQAWEKRELSKVIHRECPHTTFWSNHEVYMSEAIVKATSWQNRIWAGRFLAEQDFGRLHVLSCPILSRILAADVSPHFCEKYPP